MNPAMNPAINPAIQPQDLQLLGERLQRGLRDASAQPLAVQVRCGVKQGTLLILAQHLPDIVLNPRQIVSTLEQVFRRSQAEMNLGELPVRLYLRIVGQEKPYAAYGLTAQPVALAAVESPVESSSEALENVLPDDAAARLEPGLPRGDDSGAADSGASDATAGDAAANGEMRAMTWLETHNGDRPDSVTVPVKAVAAEAEAAETEAAKTETNGLRRMGAAIESGLFWLTQPFVLISTGVALVAFCGTLYGLTRPCVLGFCEPLQTAQQLGETAQLAVQTAQSPQDVVDAYGKLVEANYLLDRIPSWSGYHAAAMNLMQTHEQEAAVLVQVVMAQDVAMQAAIKSQKPPHPLPTWQEIEQLWQQAIAHLERVSPDSPVHQLSDRKLVEYRANLAAIQRRIAIEKHAQEQVNLARKTAQVAEARNGIALSLPTWQLTQSTWKTAMDLLRQVPQTTMPYAEAQQLLALYQPRLLASRSHLQQEQQASSTYNRALALASQAQRSEALDQWSQAVNQWQEALRYAQQVPQNTSQSTQAQTLVTAYKAALVTAQDRLKLAVSDQTAQGALARTCAGTPRVCTYSRMGNVMQVRITPSYDQALQQAAAATQAKGEDDAQAAMMLNFSPLLQAIAVAGEESQLPIQLFNANGSLFGTYDPRLDGFVNQE